jgi:probable HAF family extracellular repeat protein
VPKTTPFLLGNLLTSCYTFYYNFSREFFVMPSSFDQKHKLNSNNEINRRQMLAITGTSLIAVALEGCGGPVDIGPIYNLPTPTPCPTSLPTTLPRYALVFERLGDFYATSLSVDGAVIVGDRRFLDSDTNHPVRWTQGAGLVNLGAVQATDKVTLVADVSRDGKVVIGDGRPTRDTNDTNNAKQQAFIWTQETGAVFFDTSRTKRTIGVAVSRDGKVVVGNIIENTGYQQAFRWTPETGVVGIGYLAGAGDSKAVAVSQDGKVIVGNSGTEVFRWTQATSMVGLGTLAGKATSTASVLSPDGKAIIGTSGGQAFRWTQETGMVALGDGLNCFTRIASASPDGKIVVGTGVHSDDAVFWTAKTGQRKIWDLVVAAGINLTGWTYFSEVIALSEDQKTIIGYGKYNNHFESFRITYSEGWKTL